MIVKKNVKEIQNITVQGGIMRIRFDRVSPTQFKLIHSCTDPNQPVCPKCSAFLSPENEDEHKYEKYQYVVEDWMIDQVISLFYDYDDERPNVVAINEGYEDQQYIAMDFSNYKQNKSEQKNS